MLCKCFKEFNETRESCPDHRLGIYTYLKSHVVLLFLLYIYLFIFLIFFSFFLLFGSLKKKILLNLTTISNKK